MLKNVDMSLKGSWQIHQTPIEIFDNCFIGGGAMLIGDIKIGPNAIVAAGSVVTKDVEPGTIVGGNPAKVIGSFDSLYEKRYPVHDGTSHRQLLRKNSKFLALIYFYSSDATLTYRVQFRLHFSLFARHFLKAN